MVGGFFGVAQSVAEARAPWEHWRSVRIYYKNLFKLVEGSDVATVASRVQYLRTTISCGSMPAISVTGRTYCIVLRPTRADLSNRASTKCCT
jgi:hypothetical protein